MHILKSVLRFCRRTSSIRATCQLYFHIYNISFYYQYSNKLCHYKSPKRYSIMGSYVLSRLRIRKNPPFGGFELVDLHGTAPCSSRCKRDVIPSILQAHITLFRRVDSLSFWILTCDTLKLRLLSHASVGRSLHDYKYNIKMQPASILIQM